jgi:CubicO group peptidase (beta-lactamase class C family)
MYDLTLANSILQSGVDSGICTHAVYGLSVRGSMVALRTFGLATTETVFDLASLTKPIATATLLLQCVERGELRLAELVGPYFAQDGTFPHLGNIEIRHLATHTSGLPPTPDMPRSDNGLSREQLIDKVADTPPLHEPGTHHVYSDTGYILLGETITRAAGAPLDTVFRTRIADVAGIADLRFLPPLEWHPRIAPTTATVPVGMVHDPRARDLGGVAGHAGLFGTAGAVLRYLEIIRQGGKPLLSRGSVARMSKSQIDTAVGGQSIGWFCAGNPLLPSGDLFSDRAFGHSGFTGTMALIDPAYDVSLVLLTNRVINESEDRTRFLKLRRLFTNAIAGLLRTRENANAVRAAD